MATRPAGRSCWELSPAERRPRAARKEPAEAPASPAVLSLSHFRRSPFVCFGDVRPGASRTLPLVLHNPNEEVAEVEVAHLPAAELGFSVWPRRCVVQPTEKIVISVNWTPLKEGRVRETVTFLVNNVLKHQAILLGNAEEQKKKKKSLWNTINKKTVSASTRNKKISNTRNINKTFSVSQKVDRVRSPLQACENLATNEGCAPTESNSLTLEENEIPLSPISPVFRECHVETCLPFSVRRSTAYSSLRASGNGEQIQVEGAIVSKDSNLDEKVKTETSFNSINTSGQSEVSTNLILTPSCSSPLNIIQTQGNFLNPDSSINNTHATNNDIGLMTCLLSDTLTKDNLKAVHLESKTVHEIYQTILSPDSFVNGNYGLNRDLESESIKPILSPSQFVKDNMPHLYTAQQMCKNSPLSNENSQVPQFPQDQRRSEVFPCNSKCHCSKTSTFILEELNSVALKSDYYSFTKQSHPKVSSVKQPKRRPILSTTVTKRKPAHAGEKQTAINKSKAKRCLNGTVGECEKVIDNQKEKEAFHFSLPIIDPILTTPQSYKHETTPSTSLVARKRKSDRNLEDANVKVVTEHTEGHRVKRIHFSPSESNSVVKTKKMATPISKNIKIREKLSSKKKTDPLRFKTPTYKTTKGTKSIVAVAQSSLTFIKPLKTDIPRHPMPFAAKNMFYDERWKEKQEQAFTWWLNFILTPDDFTVNTNISEVNVATMPLGVENQHKISVPRAPTKDEMSLRAYTARCRLNRLRRTACRMFTSEKMVKAIKKLEIEIEAKRLIVRKDRHLWKDVGERQKVLNWLLSYNPLWLRIGLETVYGELISLEDNSDITGLAVFILSRLLWNPDIAAEYRHHSVPHLYRDGHEEALSKFTLKKLLLLVCFLDHAKISRLIDHDPCLFCKDAEFKASKDILLAFSRDFLSGEGDLSRHLSLLGLPVSHVQTPFDEFDFAVTNLAVDLQCGVRLVRIMELLTQNWNLSKKLRIPAISRLQKMHNVDIVLQILKSRGIQLNDEHGNTILCKDIVDRHREKTLGLLWKIAFAFQVEISLNLNQLKEEINFLKDTHSIKKTMRASSCHSDAVTNKKNDKGHSSTLDHYSESVKLLMDWVNAVCAFYNKKVENFTVSFSDGRVLCYLIHHYHPCYVPFDAICQRTTQTVECTQTGSVVLNSSSESNDSSLDMSLKALDHESNSELHKELLENEKKNFHLVRSAVRDLGGIPAMIHHSDMSNTIPDEKVVIMYLSFLCARLLDLRKEIRAARLIQTTWRKYKLRKDLKHHQERDKAARIIQSAVINFLAKRRLIKEVNAALIIQRCWRRVLAQRKLLMLRKEKLEKLQSKSASVIQRYWRRHSARERFLKLRYYSVILQSRIRMIIAVTSYKRCLWATVTIQRHWRAYLRKRQDQERYKKLKSSALIIQSRFRRWKQRKMQLQVKAAVILQRAFREWHFRKQAREKSAVVIQSWYRMHKELQKYIYIRSCIVVIQRRFRCFQIQKSYKRKRESVLTIQKYYRAYLKGKTERTNYLQKRAAAILLQAAFRRMKARNLQTQIRAACVLQSYWRMRQDKFRFLNLKKSVIKLQAHLRKHQQLQKYTKMKKAAIVIQTRFRAYVSARKVLASYQKTRSAVIVLQSAYRRVRARKMFLHIVTSVIKIQSYYRAYISRKKFLSLKSATIKFQSVVRMKQARRQYLHLREAALFIQQWYRSQKMAARKREEYMQMRESCITLQAAFRGHLVRKQMRLQREAAVSLQSYFRMRKMRQHYLKTYKAVVVIQSYYRAYKAQFNQRKKFLHVKRAATCLQAGFRGYKVRQIIKQQSRAALKIQTAFRGYSQRMKYQAILQSTVKIQRWYRAHMIVYDMRRDFLKTRAAVISLQSAYRGWKVRKQMRKEHQAAIKIQSVFRMVKAQKQFRLLKTAAVVIQQHLRALTAGRKQRMEYVKLRHAVMMLQSTWKGKSLRRQIQKQRNCAVIIQSYYRMHVQQKKWKIMKSAVLLIQKYYRAYSVGREERHLYLKKKAAVVTLQSAYRGMKVRKGIKNFNKAAVTIQSKYRAYKTQKKYAAHRASAIVIQRWYRGVKNANHQHKQYLNLKNAAIKIQAVYRGIRVRRYIQHLHRAATCIKAMFKMHQSRVRYHAMRRAAVVIQRQFRAYHQGKIQREKYLTILKAVNTLQASFRGARVRQAVRKMQVSATLIQSYYRRYRQQTYFNKLKKVTKTMQQRYRAVKERNIQLQRYTKLRHSAICIQSAFRGMRARKHLKAMHLAAILIQKQFRTLMVRRKFLSLKKTVLWTQRKYRAKHHVQQFLQLRKAVIKIQSSHRGWVVRKNLQKMRRAATLIQATFRMHRNYVTFRTWKCAAILIQQHYRKYRAAKLQRENLIRRWDSAVIIQATYKGMKARQVLREKHRAAIIIQRTYRMYRQYCFYKKLQWATKVIQEKYRANKKKQRAPQHKACKKEETCIQTTFQDVDTRKIQKQHEAAVIIQKHFKGFKTRRDYLHFRARVISVQRRCRALTATSTQAVICMQSSHRGFQEAELHSQSGAAPAVQKAFGEMITRELGTQECAALRIQSFLQMVVHRRRFIQQRRAAVTLQHYFRTWQTRKQFLQYRKAAVVLQNRYRAFLSTKHQRQFYLQIRSSAILIQAATKGFIQKRKFQQAKSSAIKIQGVWRRYKAKKYLCRVKAACKIQAWYRCWRARKQYLAVLKAVKIIQSCFRAKLERTRFLKMRASTVVIQRKWRAILSARIAHEYFLMTKILEQRAKIRILHFTAAAYYHLSALKIQRAYKLHVARKNAKKQINSVICIQRWFRAKLQQKKFIEQFRNTIKSKCEMQECLNQQNRAASVIQKAARRFLLRKRQARFNSGISKIQALWRGYIWRKKNDCTKIRAIRLSLQLVNKEIREENKLYKRTALALHYLLTYKHLSAILEALKHLEVVTRLSPLCCENMAESGAISKIFVLIRSCNRSIPCMEVIRYAVQVLLNVAKYEKTTSAVYDVENCVDTLLELLQIYREKSGDRVADKGGSIFTKTCCLLAVLLKTNNQVSDVQSGSRVVDRIYSLYKLTAHKHKVNTERILYKQKKNPSTGTPCVAEKPGRARIVSRLKPDWVLRKDNIEVTNPLQAIQMVMDTVGIPY
ncbi:PREDICTED: abnormal spindle-like microcephaly-associated protein [Chinchilla lanigera]|uniref:Assembly factor for spindle microtubules n=1 Tax=Chinchilla lanigera TaxID=34839 RepID=A0A8C2VD23_CHILA|nr:PREDICTED: abnormal spindle-like microcephaly-associated protein [Chinchilla lanigera]